MWLLLLLLLRDLRRELYLLFISREGEGMFETSYSPVLQRVWQQSRYCNGSRSCVGCWYRVLSPALSSGRHYKFFLTRAGRFLPRCIFLGETIAAVHSYARIRDMILIPKLNLQEELTGRFWNHRCAVCGVRCAVSCTITYLDQSKH